MSQDTNARIATLAFLHMRKGQICTYTQRREAKVKKGSPFIEKISECQAHLGPDYEASIRREQAKNGIPAEQQYKAGSLPWGQWIPGMEGLAIAHEKDGQKKTYLRVQFSENSAEKTPAKVQWMKDGKPSTYEECEPFLLASEKTETKEKAIVDAKERQGVENYRQPLCLTLDTVQRFAIGGEVIERN